MSLWDEIPAGARNGGALDPIRTVLESVGGIQLGWERDDENGRTYDIWIPLLTRMTARIAMVAPDGGQVSVSVTD